MLFDALTTSHPSDWPRPTISSVRRLVISRLAAIQSAPLSTAAQRSTARRSHASQAVAQLGHVPMCAGASVAAFQQGPPTSAQDE